MKRKALTVGLTTLRMVEHAGHAVAGIFKGSGLEVTYPGVYPGDHDEITFPLFKTLREITQFAAMMYA